ncbi:putative ester cyclase [Actinomycetospora succinea]|uniref:Putative ester cyclase n=1 Tax=Actinomycetospora succinea TaxID=663603 RepID=A0A4R6VH81_9PSEU|nr:ester cyclase [Actinomycetospora succinea]TDQ62577.1 putative ester cyclase [Actinomycetospora succinea]
MIDDVYRAYLACLDERRFEDLEAYVHDSLTYNGAPMTRAQYAGMIADDAAAIPDLAFVVDRLVVQGDEVAARLWFDCTPRGEFRGVAVDGRRVAFAEHVFYRFAEGRIAEVWSLIDVEAVREQLG